MAHREEVKNEQLRVDLGGAKFYWNISADVGWGCRNQTADVMLVQYLLFRGFENSFKKPIVMDGVFGPQTYKWIRAFQKEVHWTGIDGKVDAADGTRDVSTITKKNYTIHWLNIYMKLGYPLIFRDITLDKWLPSLLCNEFSKIVVDDGVIAM